MEHLYREYTLKRIKNYFIIVADEKPKRSTQKTQQISVDVKFAHSTMYAKTNKAEKIAM